MRTNNIKILTFSTLLFLLIPLSTVTARDFSNYDFSSIDAHALQATKKHEKSLESLTKYLIRPAKNDLEKTRAIFIWITDNISYDTKSYFRGSYGTTEAGDLLKSRTSVCEGYSNIFLSMADLAGLKAVKIVGFSKGYGVSLGEKVNGTNHAWNAVEIQGKWYLLDSTWGSGFMGSNRGFKKSFTEFYFLPNPEDLIFTHFPSDKKWQLLNKPQSEKTFASTLNLKPQFFDSGLTLASHKENSFTANEPLKIKIGTKKDISLLLAVSRNGKKIDENNILVTKDNNNTFTFNIRLPKKGNYNATVFATNSMLVTGKNIQYDEVASYNIYGSGNAVSKTPYPTITGAGKYLEGDIISPLNLNLDKNIEHQFAFELPWAKKAKVMLVDLKGNTYMIISEIGLEKQSDGSFAGNITVDDVLVNTVMVSGDDYNGKSKTIIQYHIK